RAAGLNVGGEQSGHLILSDFATTGDGLLAALQVLAVLVRQRRPASEVLQVFKRLPQRLKNVRFTGPSPLRDPTVQAAIAVAEGRLGASGRVLIRESGTEPLVRVMAEGENADLVANVVDSMCEVIAAVTRSRESGTTEASSQEAAA
ncbi:MAG TPA: phosphoglucosamine mutase, partial [Rhodopila sp.]|nr:phosphoglucosamine mutase [Rhodopila sp.]